MTHFIMKVPLNKWMHQNGGEYTGDYFEGSLLDNFIVTTKRGYCFIFEQYLNEWSSAYLCYFVPYKDKDDIAMMFAEFREAEEAQRIAFEEAEELYCQRFGKKVTA